jgi:murein DD-endopeptidase MepM/ murein hydrolase activator NlpD
LRWLVFVFFLFPNISFAFPGPGPNDTTFLYKPEKKFTKETLVSLIDSLFELETIPYNLISSVNRYINIHFPQPVENGNPASCYYHTWDTKGLFIPESIPSGDSGQILVLAGNYRKFCMPVIGAVTSKFGWRDSSNHYGVDLDLNKGEPVKGAFDGKVRFSGRHGAYGNVIIIRHYNGLETVYAHLSKINVKPNQLVKAGDVIGLGGSTGRSTGTHLHFETRFKGHPVNPKYFISFEEGLLVSNRVRVIKKSNVVAIRPEGIDFHVIEKGDSWYNIAQRYGLTVKELKNKNIASQFKVGKPIKLI